MSDPSPWLALIALGAFHGLNPAMGWFFAASLALYRKNRSVILVSLIPIAIGHAAAIAVVVFAVIGLGLTIDADTFRILSGLLLIAWGLYHWFFGHRHHVRITAATGLTGIGVWSFLMAMAHGAGMMLIPVLMPMGHAHTHDGSGHAQHMMATDSFAIAALAVGVHTLAMLIVTGCIAILVYQSAGFEMLKRRWINLDLAWTLALIGMGVWLLVAGLRAGLPHLVTPAFAPYLPGRRGGNTRVDRVMTVRTPGRLPGAFILFLFTSMLLSVSPAAAKRVALVIGNNAYENVPALQKAKSDAEAVSAMLAKLGFDVVTAEDVGRRAMSRAMVELEGKIAPGDTALVYFAGHGFAIDGTNYLLPVDVPPARPGEAGLVTDAAFSANSLSSRLQGKGASTIILILDACRDNPFALKDTRSMGLTRGLTRMDPAEGMFVLFSAGQGQAALDRLGEHDDNPNSVFTRTLLEEIAVPGQSMVRVAKRTQERVRDLAAKIDHTQVPAYYDQIVGDLYLTPTRAIAVEGKIESLREGSGDSVLPKLAALPGPSAATAGAPLAGPSPLANFTRSNSGWMVNVSLPEAATQFGYRLGEDGDFADAGFLDVLDQRTGKRLPKTSFEMPPDQGPVTVYVTWRDKRGEQADIFPIRFDPNAALASTQKSTLEQFWTGWVSFREWQGLKVYFTHLISYRCGIGEVRYGYDGAAPDKVFKLPPCDPANPHAVPQDATILMSVPPKTKSMSVQLTYADGTQSQIRSFNVPK